jgi:hypothetical protein
MTARQEAKGGVVDVYAMFETVCISFVLFWFV